MAKYNVTFKMGIHGARITVKRTCIGIVEAYKKAKEEAKELTEKTGVVVSVVSIKEQ